MCNTLENIESSAAFLVPQTLIVVDVTKLLSSSDGEPKLGSSQLDARVSPARDHPCSRPS
jgi:hypothetical protein